jgi:CrcB protein
MKMALIVGLGGFAGSIGRYLCGILCARLFSFGWPVGTLIVNISGCLLIGLIYGASLRFAWLNQEWRFFLITGICGGYTTFSAFAMENMAMLQQGSYTSFAVYSLATFCLGLLAVWAGMSLLK